MGVLVDRLALSEALAAAGMATISRAGWILG
jgi:hypothetical protein